MASALDETGMRGFVRRWARRAVAVPVFLLAFPVWLLTLPISLPTALVVDLARSRRGVALRSLAFFGYFFACEAIGLLLALLAWLRTPFTSEPTEGQPPSTRRERFLTDNYAIQRWWGTALARASLGLFGIRLHLEGEEACKGGPILLFIRHASPADTVLAIVTLSAPFGHRLRYVLKHQLLWDPCLDIVGQRIPNWFARRGTMRSREEIEQVAKLAENLGPEDGVLIYPEGTRYTEEKRDAILSRLEKRHDREQFDYARSLHHVLPPRKGGSTALLRRNLESGSHADALFCAHTGFEGTATLREIANGELLDRDVYIRFWRVPFAEIPTEPRAMDTWLREQWRRVDEFVDQYLPRTYARVRSRPEGTV